MTIVRLLKNQASKRMYRFLDKKMWHKKTLRFDMRVFACEHIGVSRNYNNSQIKRELRPAIQELEKVGFLEPLPDEIRFQSEVRGKWKVVFTKSDEKSLTPAKGLSGLTKKLVDFGVRLKTAKELVDNFPEKIIREKLEYVAWLMDRKDPKVSNNPPGFLIASIKENYDPVSSFETKKQKEIRQAAEKAEIQRKQKNRKTKSR